MTIQGIIIEIGEMHGSRGIKVEQHINDTPTSNYFFIELTKEAIVEFCEKGDILYSKIDVEVNIKC